MRTTSRSCGLPICLLALAVGWSASALPGGATAQAPDPGSADLMRRVTPLRPLAGDVDSFALGINDRGFVAGHSTRADDGSGTKSTAVAWDPAGNAEALPPLDGDDESFAVAINNAGMVVGHSRNNNGTCAIDTAVLWLPDGTVTPLLPLDGNPESVANGISEEGLVAGTSKGHPDDPEASCESVFTPTMWGSDGAPEALAPLDSFPEGFAVNVTRDGDVVGGSVNTSTGFDLQVTVWRGRRLHKTRLLPGPTGSFVSISWDANPDGMVVGDSLDFTFTQKGVVWDADGVASLREPFRRGAQSSGRAINARGLAAGISFASSGERLAVRWSRKGKVKALRPLPGDSQSEAFAINRSGQVAGRSFGTDASTAVIWSKR